MGFSHEVRPEGAAPQLAVPHQTPLTAHAVDAVGAYRLQGGSNRLCRFVEWFHGTPTWCCYAYLDEPILSSAGAVRSPLQCRLLVPDTAMSALGQNWSAMPPRADALGDTRFGLQVAKRRTREAVGWEPPTASIATNRHRTDQSPVTNLNWS